MTQTPSGHRRLSSANNRSHETVDRSGAAGRPIASAIRRTRWPGAASASVHRTITSTPRGARSFSAAACANSTDLPNPGPATTTTRRRHQRAAINSTRRGRRITQPSVKSGTSPRLYPAAGTRERIRRIIRFGFTVTTGQQEHHGDHEQVSSRTIDATSPSRVTSRRPGEGLKTQPPDGGNTNSRAAPYQNRPTTPRIHPRKRGRGQRLIRPPIAARPARQARASPDTRPGCLATPQWWR